MKIPQNTPNAVMNVRSLFPLSVAVYFLPPVSVKHNYCYFYSSRKATTGLMREALKGRHQSGQGSGKDQYKC